MKEDDPKVTMLPETGFDGLGHFGCRIFAATRHGERTDNDIIFFKEDLTMTSIHLKDVALGPGGTNTGSILCHQKSFDGFDVENFDPAVFFARYQCHMIPDLDEWFNFKAQDMKNQKKIHDKIKRPLYESAYRSAHRDKLISCGAGAQITRKGGSVVQVAVHLRLGDLLPNNGMYLVPKQRGRHIRVRYKAATEQYLKLFQFLSGLKEYMNSNRGGRRTLEVLVVSDSPVQTIAIIFETMGIMVEIISKEFDGVANYTLGAANMAKERVDDGLEIQLTSQVKLRFLGNSNPLVALHCLVESDILVLDPNSMFSKFASKLRSGPHDLDLLSIPSPNTSAESYFKQGY